jgi:hypothetical protein
LKIHASVEFGGAIPGEIAMHNDWILDVLADLRSFAQENGMNRLALHLDETTLLAAAEISNGRNAATRPIKGDPAAPQMRDGLGKAV